MDIHYFGGEKIVIVSQNELEVFLVRFLPEYDVLFGGDFNKNILNTLDSKHIKIFKFIK